MAGYRLDHDRACWRFLNFQPQALDDIFTVLSIEIPNSGGFPASGSSGSILGVGDLSDGCPEEGGDQPKKRG